MLDSSTDIASVYIGKVRNTVTLTQGLRIMETTDRISAFDYVFPFDVPGKGPLLQSISVLTFEQTKDILPNAFVGCLDERHMVFQEAQVFAVEFIVRRFLTGSLWRLYQSAGAAGVQQVYGIHLPANLKKNARFSEPILFPMTKAAVGHDAPITREVACSLLGQDVWDLTSRKSIELFKRGEAYAQSRGLILVDTKYEMGLCKGQVVLVDEVHTPDSSRYWVQSPDISVEHMVENPKQLSKEFLREEILDLFKDSWSLNENPTVHSLFDDPDVKESLKGRIQERYQELYQQLVGEQTPREVAARHHIPWPLAQQTFQATVMASLMPQRVLVVGNGGRDYVLGQCLGALPEVAAVYYAAGGFHARAWYGEKYLPCPYQNVADIAKFAQEKNVGLVIAGPEAPIAEGLEQACRDVGVPVLAPSLICAALETSKVFCKKVIQAAGVPTPESCVVQWPQLKEALESFLNHAPQDVIILPTVVKYDSLAAGKGVAVLKTLEDIQEALSFFTASLPEWERNRLKLQNQDSEKFQTASFLVEQLVEGEEVSAIALCNGEEFRLLPLAKDYKRRNDGQQGPNTGGMGAVCPVPVSTKLEQQIHQAFALTLQEMKKRGTPYHGFLFAGFMVDASEKAWLLEYNCRLGDPETQVILPGLGRDFWREILRTARGKPFFEPSVSSKKYFTHDGRKRVFVVGASPEYPQRTIPRRTLVLPAPGVWQQIATQHHAVLQWVLSGVEADGSTCAGRICGMLGAASTWEQARAAAYAALETLELKDSCGTQPLHYRRDVGLEC